MSNLGQAQPGTDIFMCYIRYGIEENAKFIGEEVERELYLTAPFLYYSDVVLDLNMDFFRELE